MGSKLFTTIMVLAVLGPFTYIAANDAISIKRNLEQQHEQIQQLSTEYEELDQQLGQTVENKQQSQEEVDRLEQEKAALDLERQRLEEELGAN